MKTACQLCGAETATLVADDDDLVLLDSITVEMDDLPDAVKWTIEGDVGVNLARRWSDWRLDNPAAERPETDDARVEHRFLCPDQLSMTTVSTLPEALREAVIARAVASIKARTNDEDGGT